MPQSPSYTNVGRVSDIRRGEMSIDRQPACSYYCEGQCLRKKVAPADRAVDGGILAPQDFAVSDDNRGRRHMVAPLCRIGPTRRPSLSRQLLREHLTVRARSVSGGMQKVSLEK